MLTRKKILEVSKVLFEKKGFKSVRTSEIAELAEIGEGTLFNYFKSKSELFIAALFDDLSFVEYEIDADGLESEEQIVNEIVRIIEYYVKNAKQMDKKLLKEYFSIMYDAIDTESQTIRQSQIEADQIISNKLEDLFFSLVKTKKVGTHFDIQTAVKCIYGCSITIFNEFVYSNLLSYESMMEEIRKQVEFILDGKIK
ncbi:TetR/AcrR family transcriptional regulator [Salipaludibacillus sp. HK11]|uniref:TetR/AcrR family transcriptional regulator n=1 Tax=Salipaludibacillus sp. HK11 TaxID=3394320 RepID=UPI0039FC408E